LVVTAKNKKQHKDNNKISPTIIDYICGDINEMHEQNYEDGLCGLKDVPRKSKLSSANKIKNDIPPKKPNSLSKIHLR
jgi:hypothetical protein